MVFLAVESVSVMKDSMVLLAKRVSQDDMEEIASQVKCVSCSFTPTLKGQPIHRVYSMFDGYSFCHPNHFNFAN